MASVIAFQLASIAFNAAFLSERDVLKSGGSGRRTPKGLSVIQTEL